MSADLIGRDGELAAIHTFLGGATPAVMLLEGEAGIGKTSLWRAAIAEEDDAAVLVARPTAAEAELSFAALGDLLGDVLEEALPALPAPQRHGLEAALLLADAERRPADQRTIGAALLSAVRELASRRPIVVAIDDVQWLDPASRAALVFCVRRLRDESVRLLLSARTNADDEQPDALALAIGEERLERRRIGPLSVGAIRSLLQTRLGASFQRPVLRRLYEASAGNPFLALELGRALVRAGVELRPGEPLPVPSSLKQLLEGRIARVSSPARRVLVAVSAAGTMEESTVVTVVGADAAGGVEEAVAADLLAREGDELRFSHPLLRSTAYELASLPERRVAHRRLADSAVDAEERARHLAIAVEAPDMEVASALDAAAQTAFARGAIESAAALGEQALRFTPEAQLEALPRRRMAVAGYLARAGAKARARHLIEEAWNAAEPGPERARVAFVIAWLGLGTLEQRAAALRTALADAADDVQLLAQIHAVLASLPFPVLPPKETEAHATVGFELAEKVGEPGTWVVAAMSTLWIDLRRGRGVDRARLERALAFESSAAHFTDPIAVRFFAAFAAYAEGDLPRARTMLERVEIEDRERGDTGVASTLALLADLELDAGHWNRAEALATESLEFALDAKDGFQEADARRVLVRLAALRGDADRARRLAEEATRVADAAADADCRSRIRATVGMLELSLGDGVAAAALLDEAVSFAERARVGEPALLWFVPERVEAAVVVGALEDAERMLAPFESRARQLERAAAVATALRARALIESARGDLERAVSTTEEALALHERSLQPFDRARTLLVRGSLLRRLRRRRDARATLERAISEFEHLDAAIWAARARDELARIGGRAPAGEELTSSERRVAELVADGKTNKEVAAILVVTDRTVESALTQIYRKLDVRSRTELARKLTGP
jgi:DNA-binding CsgD family transcriptional regulator